MNRYYYKDIEVIEFKTKNGETIRIDFDLKNNKITRALATSNVVINATELSELSGDIKGVDKFNRVIILDYFGHPTED